MTERLTRKQPKVFISHASEDKERFVIDFATKLRSNGIDAWLDKWEIAPGDNLIEKIFSEGIKQAEAVIVVISSKSIAKPWVTKEWTVSVVKEIEKEIKLITVILDSCEIPEYFRDTLWMRITNTEDYEEQIKKITMSIFGTNVKPPIGPPPYYVLSEVSAILNLSQIDTLILRICFEIVTKNDISLVELPQLLECIEPYNIPEQEIFDSLEILESIYYIDNVLHASGGFYAWQVSDLGFNTCLDIYYPDIKKRFKEILAMILNENINNSETISKRTELPLIVTLHLLEILESKDAIVLLHCFGQDVVFEIRSKAILIRLYQEL